jgi:hypothetical protein
MLVDKSHRLLERQKPAHEPPLPLSGSIQPALIESKGLGLKNTSSGARGRISCCRAVSLGRRCSNQPRTKMPAGGRVCERGFDCCASFCTADAAVALSADRSVADDSKLPIPQTVSWRSRLAAIDALNTCGGYIPACALQTIGEEEPLTQAVASATNQTAEQTKDGWPNPRVLLPGKRAASAAST